MPTMLTTNRLLPMTLALLPLLVACGGADEEEDPGDASQVEEVSASDGDVPSDAAPPLDEGSTDTTDALTPADPGPPNDPGATEDTTPGPQGPHVVVEPPVVNFTSTKIGETQTASFVIRNDGTDKVNIVTAKYLTGEQEGFDFVLESPTGLLVPGEKRTVDMKFTSAELGSHTAILAFETLPETEPAQAFLKSVVSLQIESVPTMAGSVPAVRFGAVPVGQSSTIDVNVLNIATDALTVESVEWLGGAPAGLVMVAEPTPILLGAGSPLKVTLTYAPGAKATSSGVLMAISDSATTPLLTIPVTGAGGKGCDGQLTCAVAALELGQIAVGKADGRTLVCRNTGTGPVDIDAVGSTLGEGDGVAVALPVLPLTLGPGRALAVAVSFAPAVEGAASGEITIETSACTGGKQKVPVTATAVAAPPAPPCGVLAPMTAELEWEWTASDGFGRVVSAPVVADVDADGAVEVVFIGHETDLALSIAGDQPGRLRALSGVDGAEKWTAAAGPTWAGGIAVGELDGKPGLEIVAVAYADSPEGKNCPGVLDVLPTPYCSRFLMGRLVCISGKTGETLWTSEPFNAATTDLARAGAPAVVDLDEDGLPEIAFGNTVFSGLDGRLQWVGSSGRGTGGHAFMTVAADVDGDGSPELVAGNTAYNNGGVIAWTSTVGDTNASAPADLDGDGDMEVFVNGPNGNSVIIDGKTGQVVTGPVNTGLVGCCASAPAVADVTSSSPGLEIITVGDDQLKVLNSQLELLWSRPVLDPDGAAGAIAFDFDGNGLAEVVYADRSAVYILRGADGQVMLELERTSTAGLDLPIVADVDGDGKAELLVTLDDGGAGGPGLRLYRDALDTWVGARPIWNQHAFSPRSVFDSGSIPHGGDHGALGPVTLRANTSFCQ